MQTQSGQDIEDVEFKNPDGPFLSILERNRCLVIKQRKEGMILS